MKVRKTIYISSNDILELLRHGKVSLLTDKKDIYYLIQEGHE